MDFSAKVRWHMANDSREFVALLQDKYRVREIVRQRGVRLANLLCVTERAEEIPFSELPADCVIKANHGSGWNLLRKDGKFYHFGTGYHVLAEDGQLLPEHMIAPLRLTEEECVLQCQKWLNSRYSTEELSYHLIPPRIIVEELLQPGTSGELKDYRFYTFDGAVRAISVGSPTYRRRNENVFFSPEWVPLPLSVYKEALPDPLPEKPRSLEQMFSAASLLGRDLGFVRVDLYDTNYGTVFGELTFYPHGGTPNSPTACPHFNCWLAEGWTLSARVGFNETCAIDIIGMR